MNKIVLVLWLTYIGLKMHLRNPMTLFIICLGFMTCSFVLAVLWGGYSGFSSVLNGSSHDNRLLVLSANADTINQSRLAPTKVSSVVNYVHNIAPNALIYLQTEAVALVKMPQCVQSFSVSIQALEPVSKLYPNSSNDNNLFVGRWPISGSNEVLIGHNIANKCNIDIGAKLFANGNSLKIVGILPQSDSIANSRLVTSSVTLKRFFNTGQDINALIVDVQSKGTLKTILANLTAAVNNVDMISDVEYYAKQAGQMFIPTAFLTIEVGGLLLLGAIVAMILSMSTTIFSRHKELAVFLTMGFSRRIVAISLALEGCAIALIGVVIGFLCQRLIFMDSVVKVLDLSSRGQLFITFTPSPLIMIILLLSFSLVAFIGTAWLANVSLRKLHPRLGVMIKNVMR